MYDMKEYIKLFNAAKEIDGYNLNDIPFMSLIKDSKKTLTCNERGKQYSINKGQVEVVPTQSEGDIPNNEIHYTASAKISEYGSGTHVKNKFGSSISWGSENSYTHTFDENTGKGIFKFNDDIYSIGWNFRGTSVTSITLPNTVKTLPKNALIDANKITSIVIPEDFESVDAAVVSYSYPKNLNFYIKNLKNYLNVIFDKEAWVYPAHVYLNDVEITNLIIPEGTKTIKNGFNKCLGLTSVSIPSSMVEIGSFAFSGCSNLTSVNIQNGLKTIADAAFYGCSGLTSITIPESVKTIGNSAFRDCTGLTGNIVIPNGVTNIESHTFYNCPGLTSVTIPSSVKTIDSNAFYGCSGLTSITIPESVKIIGDYAFKNCTGLTSINILSNDIDISNTAFEGCTSLPAENNVIYIGNKLIGVSDKTLCSYTIKNGTKFILPNAFSGCSNLTSIEIPEGVEIIGDYAFSGCSSLMSVTIPSSVKKLGYSTYGDYAFKNCTSLTSIVLPENLESTGYYTFSGCTNLAEVTILGEKTDVYSFCFSGCTNLKTVNIPNGCSISKGVDLLEYCDKTEEDNLQYVGKVLVGVVDKTLSSYTIKEGTKTIAGSAFSGCTNLTQITIPNSVTYIGRYAFANLTKLTSVDLPSNLKVLEDYAFSGCTALAGDLILPYGVEQLQGDYIFQNCKALTSITIPDSVMYIGSRTFYGCSGLTSVTLSNNIKIIHDYFFSGCTNLEKIVLGDSIETISGNSVFGGCSKLKEIHIHNIKNWLNITFSSSYNNPLNLAHHLYLNDVEVTDLIIPEGTTKINNYAFYGCTGLTSVTIPESVESIGNYAFNNCSGLTRVNISNLSKWMNIDFADGAGNPLYTAHHLYLNGSEVTDLIIPEGTKTIKNASFFCCWGLTSVTIPDSVKSIGWSAFAENTGLTSVTIPDSVTSIGNYIFENCTGLTSASLSKNITSAGAYLFKNCTGLTDITIPEKLTYIPQGMYYGCTGLTDITIPDNIMYIGESAFENCSNIETVNFGNNLIQTAPRIFRNCSKLKNAVFKDGLKYFENSAFALDTSLKNLTIPNSVIYVENEVLYAGDSYEEYPGSLKTIIVGDTVYNCNGEESLTITLGNGYTQSLYLWYYRSCFLPDTEITLSDGSKKQIKDITYNDKLKVWNFDEGHYDEGEIAWLTKVRLMNDHYYQLTFSDGTILKTTGKNSNHKVYCTDTNKFEGVAYIEVGAHVFTENGIVTITDKQYIEEDVEYYNLITKQHFNCFANGVLTSDRYGNIYPISDDMIFIKNGRPIRPYSEFEAVGIKRYWYDTLRLGENTETVDETKRYIMKLEAQMRKIE